MDIASWTAGTGTYAGWFRRPGSTFGEITDTAANDNPREFQFALKLLF